MMMKSIVSVSLVKISKKWYVVGYVLVYKSVPFYIISKVS